MVSEVSEESGGPAALARLGRERFDALVLDVMMPKMTGYEVLRNLRQRYPASELPVLLLTAKTQEQDIAEGFSAGTNDYLTKPFSRTELLARIARLPAPSRLQRAPNENKSSDLPVGISGPIVRLRREAGVRDCSLLVSLPRFGDSPQRRSVYIANENTWSDERYAQALARAVADKFIADEIVEKAKVNAGRVSAALLDEISQLNQQQQKTYFKDTVLMYSTENGNTLEMTRLANNEPLEHAALYDNPADGSLIEQTEEIVASTITVQRVGPLLREEGAAPATYTAAVLHRVINQLNLTPQEAADALACEKTDFWKGTTMAISRKADEVTKALQLACRQVSHAPAGRFTPRRRRGSEGGRQYRGGERAPQQQRQQPQQQHQQRHQQQQHQQKNSYPLFALTAPALAGARALFGRMGVSKTKTHHTWRAAASAWCSAALSSVRRSRRSQTRARSSGEGGFAAVCGTAGSVPDH
mgnify:CR=1 FL=1